MSKIRLYTSGFILYFFGILTFLMFYSVLLINLSGHFTWLTMIESSIFVWIGIYLLIYLFSNKIILDKNCLQAKFVSREVNKGFLPNSKSLSISISNIQKVVLGRSKTLGVKKDFSKMSGMYASTAKATEPLVPLICVIDSDNKRCYIETKPFSKKGVTKLFKVFKELGIETEVKDNLLGPNYRN